MDDAELTRLAVAEIVREMGDLKEPPVSERKINPIAKPNKRFLGRTLNSVLSHNKRENDRTQANCRKKLEELEERQERVKYRSRMASCDLVLSSSTEEDRKKDVKKRRKKDKTKSKNHKKYRKPRNKSKKRKSKRRNRSSSTESSSSNNINRRRSRSRKSSQHVKQDMQKHENEEQTYYEPDINAALELDAAMADNYRQHQLQQLLFYSALMVGNGPVEIHALEEEMQISDIDFTEPNADNKSVSSEVSSLNLEDGDSEGSEIMQISLSSASSRSSKGRSGKSMRMKRVKEKQSSKRSESSDNSNEVILELDSDSETTNVSPKGKNSDATRRTSADYICILSETDTDTGTQTDSDSETNEEQSGTENLPNMPNSICYVGAETVTLLSSSDSEIEIIVDKPFTQQERNIVAGGLADKELAKEMAVNLTEIGSSLETIMTSDLDKPATLLLTSPQHTTLLCSGEVQEDGSALGIGVPKIVTKDLSSIAMLPPSFISSTECALSTGKFTASAVDMELPETRPSSPIISTRQLEQVSAVGLNETLSLEKTTGSMNIAFPKTVIDESSHSSIQETTLFTSICCLSSPEKVITSAACADICLERSHVSVVLENKSSSVAEAGDLSNISTPLTAHVNTNGCKSPHERSPTLDSVGYSLVSEPKATYLSTQAATEASNKTVIESISLAAAEVPLNLSDSLNTNTFPYPDPQTLKS